MMMVGVGFCVWVVSMMFVSRMVRLCFSMKCFWKCGIVGNGCIFYV